jgi:hypothetical protein
MVAKGVPFVGNARPNREQLALDRTMSNLRLLNLLLRRRGMVYNLDMTVDAHSRRILDGTLKIQDYRGSITLFS